MTEKLESSDNKFMLCSVSVNIDSIPFRDRVLASSLRVSLGLTRRDNLSIPNCTSTSIDFPRLPKLSSVTRILFSIIPHHFYTGGT